MVTHAVLAGGAAVEAVFATGTAADEYIAEQPSARVLRAHAHPVHVEAPDRSLGCLVLSGLVAESD